MNSSLRARPLEPRDLTVADLARESPRLPLRVRVHTVPLLPECWSVNVSKTGLGLIARGDGASKPPAYGSLLELSLQLPDGPAISARGRVAWSAVRPGVTAQWALGVELDTLAVAAKEALSAYLASNQRRIGVAYAPAEEAKLLEQALGGQSRLLFADTPEAAQDLALHGNVSAMLVCGAETRAAALVEWIAAQPDTGVRPRVLLCAPLSGNRLVRFFNAAWIFRWVPPPIAPPILRGAVEEACADYALHAEGEQVAMALTASRPLPPTAASIFQALSADPAQTVLAALTLQGWGKDYLRPEAVADTILPESAAATTIPLTTVSEAERYGAPRAVAEGGVGVIVAYTDSRLGRRVALKTLQPKYAQRQDLVAMLAREARITGSLEHPNIIPVYDAGVSKDGLPFYVMKLVEAPTLADVLDPLADEQAVSDYPLGRLLRIFVQVCQAVDYAHSHGVIHCDLKPANVLVGSFGQVLVVDWGLAFVAEEGTICRGGTLGFVSPEQMESGGAIDARTDVYALGSILYNILTRRRPFEDDDYRSKKGVRHPGILPTAPREIPFGDPAPEELEEICIRSMAVRPDERTPGAGALAQAIEAFLEGTKERERRRRRADDLVKNADDLATNYFELLGTRPDRMAAVQALRTHVAPWEPPERKRELWDAEDSLSVIDTLAVRTLHAAASTYEQALDEVRGHEQARRGLVRLYASELKRAEQRGDERDRVYFEGLVKQYDDGSFARAAAGTGALTIECMPAGVHVEMSRFEEQNRRLIPTGDKSLGTAPLRDVALELGSYQIDVTVPGGRPVRFPVVIKGGERVRIFADLLALADEPRDEVLVPGGPAILGSGEGVLEGDQIREVDVPSFFIERLPVSFRDYLEFLTQVVQNLGNTAHALTPRHGQGQPFWRWNGSEFVIADIKQWGDNAEALLEFPVFGVDVRCAEAYASWKSRRTGRRYRLPTEGEWEKAARGTDGRLYPWGNHFDASFCCMRGSNRGPPRPRPRGMFKSDESPFGVRDMAGGVAEWVTPAPTAIRERARESVSRGGAWCDWRTDCLLPARRPYVTGERSARVGFRLARDAPSSIGYARG
jgi:serine/threonine protein kinase/formylglycine-generating enzyme required for sulfatase activity